jgi:hypothetical protein
MSTDGIHVESRRAIQASGCAASAVHTVQLYRTDDYLLSDLSRWVTPALNAGASAVIIATEPHRVGLEELLRAQGVDLSRAAEEGRYLDLDAEDTLARFMRDGWPDAARFNQVIGPVIDGAKASARSQPPRVYAFGEMVALLWSKQKYQAATRLEQLWNELLRSRSFQLRCAYPVKYFGDQGDGLRFLKLCGEHSHVIAAEDPHNQKTGRERCRILSVSTNSRLLITRNDSLAVAGYSVASPKEPEEAAFLLATQSFDVIVIADSVRQKKRAELISALRAIRPDIPIVFVHAGGDFAAEPLADMTVNVTSGPLALITALDKHNPIRRVA